MVTLYYGSMLVLSVILSIIYAVMWHKHFDVHLTIIFILIPIINLAYFLYGRADSLDTTLLTIKITYLGGYLILIIMLSVLELCHIKLKRWMVVTLFVINTVIYASVLTIGRYPFFYKNIFYENVDGVVTYHKEYGFMRTAYNIMTITYFGIILAAIGYSYFKKKNISRNILYMLLLPIAVTIICFYAGNRFMNGVYLTPLSLVFAQIMYLFIVDRMCLYDISDSAIDSLVQHGDTGFISFDKKLNYLGCNETALRTFPELETLTVDRPADGSEVIKETALKWLSYFIEDETHDKFYYTKDEHIYLVDINDLFDGTRKRGYQFVITDDTQNQQYISLINSYNNDLKKEVAEKTKNIVEMHDKLIMGMAAMVESRDNSTGGHIRRTSDVVRILIDEIKKDNELHLSDEFCRDIIKAAPMHDLGKIAVDDAILRKPGRFTDEEFEIMKTHAAEGARVIHKILEGTDDINFHIIAENVAHYHHERWDGSGYPDGLKGEEIPLEARIMAVADVYDALVSKRVYKERMSFEKADAIIMDGMGKHFDKRLEKYYVSARSKLEKYYTESDAGE